MERADVTNSTRRAPAPVAVLLVAGIGERLRPLTLHRPKALVEVGGESMLARSVRMLVAHGVEEIVLATGFEEGAVREAMRDVSVRVSYCPNPLYRSTQNAMSLLGCEEAVAGRSFYKLDGDLLFQPEALTRLDAVGGQLAVAVDTGVGLGQEEMKVRLRGDGRMIEAFGKGLDPASCQGESIGVERVNGVAVSLLFHGLREAREAGETHLYYEDVYGRLIVGGLEAEAVDVSDLGWTEVDTAEDLSRADAMVRAGEL
jgi:choline kinase